MKNQENHYEGDLVVTVDTDKEWLKTLQSIGGNVTVCKGATFAAPETLKNYWGKKNGDAYANVIYADKLYTPYKSERNLNVEGKEITVYEPLCVGVLWTVTDGKYWSHGKTLRQAIEDLNFKYLKQNKDELKKLDVNKSYSVEEIVNFYRVITGACLAGCEQFVKNNCEKESYTISEAMEIVEKNNAYESGKFKEFFNL